MKHLRNKPINKLLKILLRLVLLLIIVYLLYFGYCIYSTKNIEIQAEYYRVTTDVSDSFRIVQLTDLHNAEFGADNRDLIKLVEEQHPDIIVMTGDMLNRDDQNTSIIENLIMQLSDVAPVYYGYGNHEYEWEANWSLNLRNILEESGANVLENEYMDIIIKDQKIRIAGYMGYYRQPGMLDIDEITKAEQLLFMDEFESSQDYKILLNHIPTAWLDWNYIDQYAIDLVFCGHYHGGQIILPIFGGVYAPYVGFNPTYYKGIYFGEKATCVLSTGLGNEYKRVPRLNNPPEIVVTDVIPQNYNKE